MIARRSLLSAFALLAAVPASSLTAEDSAWAALREPGAVVLFRHALAPGGGDPPGMRLDDCSTQRNLNEAGRAQARRISEAFRARGVEVGGVLTSEWCRCRETAELAFPGRAVAEPAFNSFFGDRSEGPARTTAAQTILDAWSGPGALVVSTHFVNISALTGIGPRSGEGIVMRRGARGWEVVGRVAP